MALSHIRSLRRAHRKPAMVSVVIGGTVPAWLDDGPLLVRVAEVDNPQTMDWTPLVGVWVTMHWLTGGEDLALGVVRALEAAGAKLFGASGPNFSVSLTSNRSDDESLAVRREREMLWTQ